MEKMSFNNALWITSHYRQGFSKEEIQQALNVSKEEIKSRFPEKEQESYAHSWGWFEADKFLNPPAPVVREEFEEEEVDDE